jgi:hypothetical protein
MFIPFSLPTIDQAVSSTKLKENIVFIFKYSFFRCRETFTDFTMGHCPKTMFGGGVRELHFRYFDFCKECFGCDSTAQEVHR